MLLGGSGVQKASKRHVPEGRRKGIGGYRKEVGDASFVWDYVYACLRVIIKSGLSALKRAIV